jgi:hypothetical protein
MRIRHLKLRPLYHLINLEENHIPTLTDVMASCFMIHLKYIGNQRAYDIHLTSIFFKKKAQMRIQIWPDAITAITLNPFSTPSTPSIQ